MVKIRPNYIDSPRDYFFKYDSVIHRQYDALRTYYYDNIKAEEVAKKFKYSLHSFYTLIKRFKKKLLENPNDDPFFLVSKFGRKEKDSTGDITKLIIKLRKQYLSVPDIKVIADSQGYEVSEKYIYNTISEEGFSRLPRRSVKNKKETISNLKDKIIALKSEMISRNKKEKDEFLSDNVGLLCLIPIIKKYNLDKVIKNSKYPYTSFIGKESSILSFLALKSLNIRRYSADDLWCMDRGSGLFAKLNVLPKTAWFSSYSDRVTPEMNLHFLRELQKIWKNHELLSDTMNLDFTTIPYWGGDEHLENNWSGKRHKALSSILAVLAQDPDSGIIDYGNANIRHVNESDVILEFLDFYRDGNKQDKTLKYLIFDSKFTNYQNLNELNKRNIKFITIRRRGKNIVDKLNQLKSDKWTKIHVMSADSKGRTIKYFEKRVSLSGYEKKVRQIAITGHGKIKPALIITNDFKIEAKDVVRKYSRRWIVEKGISEQIEFFHLNRVSSSMVIKVDFDLTMSIFAHNIYRLFAMHLEGYSNLSDISIFEKFINNSGFVKITKNLIEVKLKKKRNLPKILSLLNNFKNSNYNTFMNRKIIFSGASTS